MGAETSQKLARVLERKHYLLMSAQVKCREEEKEEGGKMFWLTENKRKRKKCKENIIPGFFFQFEPAMTFSTSFPNDAITLRICLSILLLFWCICKERTDQN